jgi:microcystin-dependent protein
MASSDFQIDNQSAQDFRLELNDALQALATQNSRSSNPPTTYEYMWWYSTTENILKMRNGANDDWINIASFNQTTNEFQVLANSAGADLKADIYNGFLANHTTDHLSEGAVNLFFTTARARASISVDPASKLTYDSGTGQLSHTHLYDSNDFATDLGNKTTSDLTEGSNLYFTQERVDDRVAQLIQSGQTSFGIDITYDDANNFVSIRHHDTSNQPSMDGVIITGLTLDGYGHVTSINATNEEDYKNNILPVGIITMWSGSTSNIPTGWALCDGNNGTPNLQNRFVVGAGDQYTEGQSGGAAAVNLTTSQMPNHTHDANGLHLASAGSHSHTMSGSTDGAGAHTHTVKGGDGGNYGSQKLAPYLTRDDAERNAQDPASISTVGNHSHSINATIDSAGSHTHQFSGTTGATGSGDAHENRPPYYALCYIMKI